MIGTKEMADLKSVFLAGVERVDPYRMMTEHMTVGGDTLRVDLEETKLEIDLEAFERIVVIGAGKATAKMARAVEDILGERITQGLISVKYGHVESLKRTATIEASHPVPDEEGLRAAQEIARVAKEADEKTLVITLISGGGSALLPYPLEREVGGEMIYLSLKDKQETTRALLECGAAIEEINCVRKHLSNIKGGQLSRLIYPGTSVNFILSDVVGDRLDTIASGLTTFDQTTFSDARQIIAKYGLENALSDMVRKVLEYGVTGKINDTPKEGDMIFSRVHNVLIGTNYVSLLAAGQRARTLGYHTVILSSRIIGEAREIAKVFAGIARDIREHDLVACKPACVVAGGETTVHIRGGGKGGRNQELALSFLETLAGEPDASAGIYFLSASTDGNDGPTDAAGAFASLDVWQAARAASLDIAAYLDRNDSYHFFDAIGYLLKTGPTNTNVCDLQILIVV
jgi:hydroxypyruvate reductase